MTDEEPVVQKKSSLNVSMWMTEVGIFVLNLILPVLVGGGILFWLASVLNLWQLDRTIASILFAVVLVFLCLIISIIVSGLRKKKLYRIRLVIMVLGGILIPLLVFVAASLLPMAPGVTYMARAIQWVSAPPVDATMVELSSVVIASQNSYTKVAGIDAINSTHSPAAMEQLFQVLNQDQTALSDYQVSDALSKAIAAYGSQAQSELMAYFQKHEQSGAAASGSQPNALYDRYFAGAVDGLQTEIKAQPLTAAAIQDQLQQLSALSDQIKSSLIELQTGSLLSGGDPVFNFVLDTFLQMNLTSDDSVAAFARSSAADTRLPDSARGKAMLLLAKLGGKDDLPGFYQYLTGSSEVIQANALEAIANLNNKLNNPSKTN